MPSRVMVLPFRLLAWIWMSTFFSMVETPLPPLAACSSSLRSIVKDTTVPDAKLSEIFLVSAFSALAETVISRATPGVVAPVSVIVPLEWMVTESMSLPARRPVPIWAEIEAASLDATLAAAFWPMVTSSAVAL